MSNTEVSHQIRLARTGRAEGMILRRANANANANSNANISSDQSAVMLRTWMLLLLLLMMLLLTVENWSGKGGVKGGLGVLR